MRLKPYQNLTMVWQRARLQTPEEQLSLRQAGRSSLATCWFADGEAAAAVARYTQRPRKINSWRKKKKWITGLESDFDIAPIIVILGEIIGDNIERQV